MEECKLLTNIPNLLPGWGCCKCRRYNGAQRAACLMCGHPYCGPPYEVVTQESFDNLLGKPISAITKIREKQNAG